MGGVSTGKTVQVVVRPKEEGLTDWMVGIGALLTAVIGLVAWLKKGKSNVQ